MATADFLIHPAEFWAATDTLKRINKRKLCLAAGRGNCDGKIVEGHTIPRSQLQRIAIDGHVYHVRATPEDLLENDGRFIVGKKGIGDFSVLSFFCAQHDRDIFSPIENEELVFDPLQLSLLHYRAMGSELYKKMNGLEGARHQTSVLQSRSYKGDREKLEFAKVYEFGSELGLRDMGRTFSLCESIICEQQYGRINGLILRFKKIPTIMTVGGFSPKFDYNGQRLQRLGHANATYEQMGLSILDAKERAAVVFTWIADAKVCYEFAQSLVQQDSMLFTTLAIQTAFEHVENTCMNMKWWDALLSIERQKLLTRMQLGGSPFEDRKRGCLQFCGINFDQWDFDDFNFVGGN
jgi:hypothetical protein